MGRKRVLTEEQKARDREYSRKYRASHKEEIAAYQAAYQAAYRAAHKEKIAAYKAEYQVAYREEIAAKKAAYYVANKEKIAAKNAAYRAAHKEEIAAYRAAHKEEIAAYQAAYNAAYYVANKEKIADRDAAYIATKRGRAVNLVGAYSQRDKNRGFDASNNVTAEWVEKNIFSGQKCIYCGDSEWEHLGCDRIDNSKPHTPDNCIPCCRICNIEKQDRYSVEDFIEYRKLHPRTLGTGIEKSWEISELPNGLKVIKKKQTSASA